jgi:hypothetical protein
MQHAHISEVVAGILQDEATQLNGGRMPEKFYIGAMPVYRQPGGAYSLDKEGSRLLSDHEGIDTTDSISLHKPIF